MIDLRQNRQHVPRAVVLWLLPALMVACLAFSQSFAACLPSADPTIRQLQILVDQDAKAALRQVQSLLNAQRGSGQANGERLAALYDVQAQAYSILELTADARESVAKGLLYATGATDPIRLDLLATLAENVYDQADIDAADKLVEGAHALQQKGSLADTCMLTGRGLLQFREGREDLAIASLTQAYNDSKRPQYEAAHTLAAATLSTVLRGMGDYDQALALNQEALDWDTAQKASLALSVDRFLRARIYSLMGKREAAIDEFMESRHLSAQVDDDEGLAFVDVRVCELRIELGQWSQARPDCNNALKTFIATKYLDETKETQALLARIELGEGSPEKALAILNGVLDKRGVDLQPRRVADLYAWRARTNAALHNFRDAYADLTEYMTRYTATHDADQGKQAAALRARFETDREIERNTVLKRELDVSRERSERQAQQLRWNAILAVSGVLVIALLVYFLITNNRYRQQLVRLASQDALTGLPNRRRTAELATEALSAAGESGATVAIALIDMDHFKFINDRCGHATGDYVLQNFARLGLDCLRPGDVLGRWGGEEFLLVMPNASVEVALGTLDRLRTLTFGIHLPPTGAGMRVSLSAGVAIYESGIRSLDDLIARADCALYAAKNEGRDLVRVADANFASSSGIRRATRL